MRMKTRRKHTIELIELNWFWRQILVSFSKYWLNDCVICVFVLSSFSFRDLSKNQTKWPSSLTSCVICSNILTTDWLTSDCLSNKSRIPGTSHSSANAIGTFVHLTKVSTSFQGSTRLGPMKLETKSATQLASQLVSQPLSRFGSEMILHSLTWYVHVK